MHSDGGGLDRRRTARRTPAPEEPLSRVRLRAGRELQVVDLSSGGALVEGGARLLPGTHVDVHVVTRDGRVLVRSRIARAYVSHVEATAIRYRGALDFDRAVDTSVAEVCVPEVLLPPEAAALSTPPELVAGRRGEPDADPRPT